MHRARRSAWWFSSDGSGRFDLPIPYGTCYLAEDALAAFLETTRGLTILSEDFLSGRRLFTSELASQLRLADLTAAAAYGYGVTGELSSTSDYMYPQAWARALHAAGFHGIRYHVRHDPRSDLVAVAWFGRAGRFSRPPPGYSQAVPTDVLLAAAPFGIRVATKLKKTIDETRPPRRARLSAAEARDLGRRCRGLVAALVEEPRGGPLTTDMVNTMVKSYPAGECIHMLGSLVEVLAAHQADHEGHADSAVSVSHFHVADAASVEYRDASILAPEIVMAISRADRRTAIYH